MKAIVSENIRSSESNRILFIKKGFKNKIGSSLWLNIRISVPRMHPRQTRSESLGLGPRHQTWGAQEIPIVAKPGSYLVEDKDGCLGVWEA